MLNDKICRKNGCPFQPTSYWNTSICLQKVVVFHLLCIDSFGSSSSPHFSHSAESLFTKTIQRYANLSLNLISLDRIFKHGEKKIKISHIQSDKKTPKIRLHFERYTFCGPLLFSRIVLLIDILWHKDLISRVRTNSSSSSHHYQLFFGNIPNFARCNLNNRIPVDE